MRPAAALCFCPGLFKTSQGAQPTGANFYRNLPSNNRGRWGIYAILLANSGCLLPMFVCSFTDMKLGVPNSRTSYDRRETKSFILPN